MIDITIPNNLLLALENDLEAKTIFEQLPKSHQKEYITWISEAKKEETKQNRILKTIEMLKKGKKTK